jgi:hypothetical protein
VDEEAAEAVEDAEEEGLQPPLRATAYRPLCL